MCVLLQCWGVQLALSVVTVVSANLFAQISGRNPTQNGTSRGKCRREGKQDQYTRPLLPMSRMDDVCDCVIRHADEESAPAHAYEQSDQPEQQCTDDEDNSHVTFFSAALASACAT